MDILFVEVICNFFTTVIIMIPKGLLKEKNKIKTAPKNQYG